MNIQIDDSHWLRSLAARDLPALRDLLNTPEIEEMLVGWNFPLNPDEHARWFGGLPLGGKTQRFSLVEVAASAGPEGDAQGGGPGPRDGERAGGSGTDGASGTGSRDADGSTEESWRGFAGLWNIDWKDRHAEIGLALAPGAQGKGLGQKLIRGLSDYAFRVLNLNRLDAYVLAYNGASRKAFLNCGYSHEGSMRNKVFKRGKYVDLEVFGLLQGELVEG